MITPNQGYTTTVSASSSIILVAVNGVAVQASIRHLGGNDYQVKVDASHIVCAGPGQNGTLVIKQGGNVIQSVEIGPC